MAQEQIKLDSLVTSKLDNVVALELARDGMFELFIRRGDTVESQKRPCSPFLFLRDGKLFEASPIDADVQELSGDAPLARLAAFTSSDQYIKAVDFLKKEFRISTGAPGSPVRALGDLRSQALLCEEIRFCRGMTFGELRRLQFDIETVCAEGYSFSNPERDSDQIVIISISDSSGYEKVLTQSEEMDEKSLLEAFVKVVQERDPDVIEGHNIFRFDLPYIETRAKKYKVKLALGRNGELLKRRPSRFAAAERTINYTKYELYGRSIVDSMHLAIFHDIVNRDLESFSLKYLAQYFGVASEERTYVDGDTITQKWQQERDTLIAYALDDVREVKAICDILLPSYFYLAQLLPLSLQDVVVKGNASAIDLLLTGEYYLQRHSLPFPEAPHPFAGGLTASEISGVFDNVWHCDVRSLYPSIILSEKWNPVRDKLGVFSRMLETLRLFRLQAKDAAKRSSNRSEKDRFDALQSSFKILINSFYGYLGFATGTFNDFKLAEKVTARGREILLMMRSFLESEGALIIEMDTDGIYFQPPQGVDDTGEFQKRIQSKLPSGIEVDLDATYRAMFAYKSKNYALLDHHGTMSITGAALKSRGLEPFQRRALEELIALLLDKRSAEVNDLYMKYAALIEKHELPLADLAKSETLNDSVENYKKKLEAGNSRRSAAYELADKSHLDLRNGDQIRYYITGDKKKVSVVDNSKLLSDAPSDGSRDENIAYYLNKLDELFGRFDDFYEKNGSDETRAGELF